MVWFLTMAEMKSGFSWVSYPEFSYLPILTKLPYRLTDFFREDVEPAIDNFFDGGSFDPMADR